MALPDRALGRRLLSESLVADLESHVGNFAESGGRLSDRGGCQLRGSLSVNDHQLHSNSYRSGLSVDTPAILHAILHWLRSVAYHDPPLRACAAAYASALRSWGELYTKSRLNFTGTTWDESMLSIHTPLDRRIFPGPSSLPHRRYLTSALEHTFELGVVDR